MVDKFWLEDPLILVRDDEYVNFIPNSEMTRVQQLNAISRFFIYYYLLAISFKQDTNIPLIGLISVAAVHYVAKTDPKVEAKENVRKVDRKKRKKLKEKRESDKIYNDPELGEGFFHPHEAGDISDESSVDDSGYESTIHHTVTNHNKTTTHNNVTYGPSAVSPAAEDLFSEENDRNAGHEVEVQVGQLDPNGNLLFNEGDDHIATYEQNREKNPGLSVEEIEEMEKKSCRRPTPENPFMNTNIEDYGNGSVPVACNADDVDINNDMTAGFNDKLFRDIEDLWERQSSERQFYSTPSRVYPNDQTEFANWLYRSPSTCKENQEGCLRYEDLRLKRPYGSVHLN